MIICNNKRQHVDHCKASCVDKYGITYKRELRIIIYTVINDGMGLTPVLNQKRNPKPSNQIYLTSV